MTNAKQPTTHKEVEAVMAAVLNAECATDIGICMPATGRVTVFGVSRGDVDTVVAYVTRKCGWLLESREDDEECGSFAYLTTP